MLKGIDAVKCPSIKLGLVTTPQLHFVTMNHELNATVRSYIDYYADAFIEFQHIIDSDKKIKKCYMPRIAVDCANGVGALHILQLADRLRDYLEILPFNDNIDAKPLLNNKCGAEFVQKEGHLPIISKPEVAGLTKMASFDGDADRLIYFWKYGEEKARVIDGDKQFALLTLYISQLLYKLDLPADMMILVNTGYANGQAVKFLESNDIQQKRVPTGVKNAHPITSQYVIGANDEPNGHGTIQVKWPELNAALAGKEDLPEAKRLVGLLKMTNLAVGDAICNLLMIESVLKDKDFSIENFMSLY